MKKDLGLVMMCMLLQTTLVRGQASDLNWQAALSLPDERGIAHLGLAGAVVGVSNGALLVGGGANFPAEMPWKGGTKQFSRDLYVYVKEADGSVGTVKGLKLPFPLAYAASCSTPYGLVVAGGEQKEALSKLVYLLNWSASEQQVNITPLPDLPFALTNAAIAYAKDRVFVAGGELEDGVADQLWMLNLKHQKTGWTELVKLPYPVSHSNLVAQDEALLLIGGRKRNESRPSEFYRSVWQLDIGRKSWQKRASLPEALSAAAALADAEGGIWFFGGDSGVTFRKVEALQLALKRATKKEAIEKFSKRKEVLQAAHPGFSRKVWRYSSEENAWEERSPIPFDAPVTTTATFWEGSVILPSGEIRAGVRSPRIWIGQPLNWKAGYDNIR